MLKIKLIIIKIYSFSNYKTNIISFFKKIKKKKNKDINYLNYLINNLNYNNKKKISCYLYLFICNEKIKYIRLFKNYYFLSNKNIYINEINKNYILYEKLFLIYLTKINFLFELKIIKKIFTNVLVKYNKQVYEDLTERYVTTLMYVYINNPIKIKSILKLYLNYADKNLFYFLKNIKKICLLIYSNKEDYSNKIYIGMMNNNNNNINNYLIFLINNLFKKNIFKVNISLEIYNFDIINIIKNIKIFKKIKINLIIGIPDLFIEFLIKKKNWCLFDSNLVKKEYEFYIQSFYDEYIGYGSFREMYKKIIKNNKILKISINSKKLLFYIIKNKIKIIYIDKINRENLNKHIGCLTPNCYHGKIYDRNNYFNKKLYYIKNANIIIKRNNNYYLEIKFKQNFLICNNNIRNFFLKFKIMDYKNDFLITQREINFHLNFRIKPILFETNYLNHYSKNYIIFNLLKVNTLLCKYSEPYIWYPGSDIYNNNFFYKNNFKTYKWNRLILYIKNNKIKCSLNLNIKKTKKNMITIFDNYLLKKIIILWQKQK